MQALPDVRPLKVLHVDDDPMNRLVMDHLLRGLGHAPTGVASGAEALRRLDQQAFEVILTDIHMPDIDGVELLERVLAGRDASLPVIAVTADVMTRPAVEFQRLGFAGAIAKPILLAGMQRALENASRPVERRTFASSGLARG